MSFSKVCFSSVQFSSVAQSCLTLCNPINHSTPGLPVHHQLSEFTQTHVHRVSDAIQPFHPLSSPSPPAPNPSQHQSLFQWVNSPHQVAKVLEFQLQHHSVWRNSKADLFQNGLIGSPESPDQVKNLTLVRGQVGLGNEWNCQELRWMGPCEKGCCYSVPVNYHPQKH